MDISTEDRRRAFTHWLRTGRLAQFHGADGVEVKFNPWHDPGNGQFTFSNSGRRWGGGVFTGGGGGSFGGGGATNTYPWPDEPKPPRRKTPPHARPQDQRSKLQAPRSGPANGAQPPSTTSNLRRVERNGYEYQIDAQGRTRRVSGNLRLGEQPARSRAAQAQAGGMDRRASDDGGHYIAARFDGPTDAFNHFAQDANFNRGGYRALEDQWAREKRAGHRVVVKIAPVYHGASKRPAMIDVWFTVDGHEESAKFPNERKGKIRGR